MTSSELFDRVTLDRLLYKFVLELDNSGVKGSVKLVGGAALSLYYFERDATRDIDAGMPSDPRVGDAILKIAKEEGLEKDWINSNATQFFGFPPAHFWEEKMRVGGIVLQVASSQLLLVMKLNASRGRRDNDDIRELLKLTEVKSIGEVEEIFNEVYAQETLKPQAHELLLAYFEEKSHVDKLES